MHFDEKFLRQRRKFISSPLTLAQLSQVGAFQHEIWCWHGDNS